MAAVLASYSHCDNMTGNEYSTRVKCMILIVNPLKSIYKNYLEKN